MRTHTAISLAALLATSLPAQLSAQRGRAMARPLMSHETFQPPIPREPESRAAHAPPTFEPGRPRGRVPYVRDGHWYGHAAPDDARFRLARPFEFGRFRLVGPSHVFTVTRVDLGARRIWLPGGGFEIAAWDWGLTAPWCWTCDDVVVYLDPDHPGWYLVYNVRMGEYVHAIFVG